MKGRARTGQLCGRIHEDEGIHMHKVQKCKLKTAILNFHMLTASLPHKCLLLGM